MKRIGSAIAGAHRRVQAKRIGLTYTAGVLAGSAAGFFSPVWFLGFIPLSAGLLWASYDLVEVPDGESSPTPRRSHP